MKKVLSILLSFAIIVTSIYWFPSNDIYAMTCVGYTDGDDVTYFKANNFKTIDARSPSFYYYEIKQDDDEELDRAVTGTCGVNTVNNNIYSQDVFHYDDSRLMLGDIFQVTPDMNMTSLFVKQEGDAPENFAMAAATFANSKLKYDGTWVKNDTYLNVNTGQIADFDSSGGSDTTQVVVFFKADFSDLTTGSGRDVQISWHGQYFGGKQTVNWDEYAFKYVIFHPFTYTIVRSSGTEYLKRWGMNPILNDIKDRQNETGFKGWIVTDTASGKELLQSSITNPIKPDGNMLEKYIAGKEFYIDPFTNLTFTAVYDTTDVTFHPNGGSLPNPGANLYVQNPQTFEQAKQGSENTLSIMYGKGYFNNMSGDIPSKLGYKFLGWYTTANGGDMVYNDKGECNKGSRYWDNNGNWIYAGKSLNLYAHWELAIANYSVQYYFENANDNKYTHNTNLAADVTKSGLIGSTPSDDDIAKPSVSGYYYSSTTKEAIKADGSSVMKVYYKRNTHKVTTNKTTGVSSVSGGGTYKQGESVKISASLSTGYNNARWVEDTENAATQWGNDYSFTMPDRDASYTAYATPKGYTLTFNPNGGSLPNPGYNLYSQNPLSFGSVAKQGTSNSVTVEYDAGYFSGMGSDLPTRTGYDFTGWFKNSTKIYKSDGTVTNDGTYWSNSKWKYDGDTTLKAGWEAHQYTVTYKKGTTSDTKADASETFTYDKESTLYSSSYFTGRAFKLVLNTNKANANIMGYNAGTASSASATTTPSSVSNITGNLSFKKWSVTNSTNSSYNNKEVSAGTKAIFNFRTDTGNTTLTALWNSSSHNLPSPTLSGYTFLGWYDAAVNGTKQDNSITFDPQTTDYSNTFYAHWQANSYTLNFNYNKPSASRPAMTGNTTTKKGVTFDNKVGDLPSPSMTGWTFNGWNLYNGDSLKKSGMTSSYIWGIVGDGTAKAQWSPNQYTVTFDVNDKTGTPVKATTSLSTLKVKYDYSDNNDISGYSTSKKNWTFLGWYDDPTEGNLVYDDKGNCVNNTGYWKDSMWCHVGDITVYAHWRDDLAPTVSIDKESGKDMQEIELIITVKDNDNGSGLSPDNSYEYYVSTDKDTPTGGTWKGYTSGTAFKEGKGTDGYYWIFIKVVSDNYGNKSSELNKQGGTGTISSDGKYHIFGVYIFDNTPPTGTGSYSEYGVINGVITGNMSQTVKVSDAYDNISGVKRVWLVLTDIDNNKSVEKDLTATSGVYRSNYNMYADTVINAGATIRVQLKAVDRAGNEATWEITSTDWGKDFYDRVVTNDMMHWVTISTGVYQRDNFRIEAVVDPKSSPIKNGRTGTLLVYTFGLADSVSAYYDDTLNKPKDTAELDRDMNFTRAGLVKKSSTATSYVFRIPLYAPYPTNSSQLYENNVITAHKGTKDQSRKVNVTIGDTLLNEIVTIIQ